MSTGPGQVQWDEFVVLSTRPAETRYQLLSEASYYVFFALAAGPRWIVSCTDLNAHQPGDIGNWDEYDMDTRESVDQRLDETLALVGQPPRPHGRDWYFDSSELPARTAIKIARRITGSVDQSDATEAMVQTWTVLDANLRASLDAAAQQAP